MLLLMEMRCNTKEFRQLWDNEGQQHYARHAVSEVPEASEFEAADATGSTGDRTGKRGG